MTVRTEYAVRYTERLDSPPAIDSLPRSIRNDPAQAKRLLGTVQAWQSESGLPADAEIVTRTITTTDWVVA